MIEHIEIAKIKPADYNPRFLSEQARERLIASIGKLGLIKPIVLRRSDFRVIAGHQRSRCLKELGNMTVPCFFVDNVSSEDEVRFNQLHNRLEIERTEGQPVISVDTTGLPFNKFVKLPHDKYTIKDAGLKGGVCRELSKLIIRYGEFGSAVCDEDGNIIVSSIYALCTLLLGRDLYVYRLTKEQAEYAKDVFSQSYGDFNYDNIKRDTFIQTLAQMNRLSGNGKAENRSKLYELHVIPYLTKDMRALDFGAGKKGYATMLRKHGYNIKALEFFYRNSKNAIDVKQVREDFAEIVEDVEANGPFDVVICDSVLNSVDSPQAEISVLKTLQSLCKTGGKIFVSGRPIDKMEQETKCAGGKKATFYFFDKDGFTANLRQGYWFFQRGHTNGEIAQLGKFFGEDAKITRNDSSFQVAVTNENRPSTKDNEDAIIFEFTLPLPTGRYDLDKPILKALEKWDR